MVIVLGMVMLLLIVLGIVFSSGRGSCLIAGYNTASPKEKEQYDEKALCRAVGGLMFACAACFGVMMLSAVFDNLAFLWTGFVLFFVVIIVGIIYLNTSKNIKRK